mmetsp:Transcript_81086/g.158419  ORF Transcript_81086/g.158419 Transcript_81086/m.158419 type:complete len:215 (-) Transcript_81086:317-961(-)
MESRRFNVDKEQAGKLEHLTHAKSLLSQVYFRQNMYVVAAQHCDAQDNYNYLIPILLSTGVASFLGFACASSLLDESDDLRNGLSLFSGLLGVVSTMVVSLRNSAKYDVKAEMFRAAAGQYRLLATQLEERIRSHRMKMINEKKKPEAQKAEMSDFKMFFEEMYSAILRAQSEMKYFPPAKVVDKWKKARKLLPNEVDQPEIDRYEQNALLDQF